MRPGNQGRSPSRYDVLHDKYDDATSVKDGTRYERLAAYVLKALHRSGAVVQDLKLVGRTGVKHQIDVQVEVGEERRRILVECKDFDRSGSKVGLEIVRSFWAAVEDTRPDEAIIIACTGFTRDAQKYARGKSIKLVILRGAGSQDLVGILRRITVEVHLLSPTEPKVCFVFATEEHSSKFQEDLTACGLDDSEVMPFQPVYIETSEGRFQINEWLSRRVMRDAMAGLNGARSFDADILLEETKIEVEERGGIPLPAIHLQFEIRQSDSVVEMVSLRIAELVLEGFGDRGHIIYDTDLNQFAIDPVSGAVSETASQTTRALHKTVHRQ